MPPKAKTATVPANSAQLCDICESTTLDPGTTAYGCEHGSWVFDPAVTGPEATASEDELRAALLASLDEATLRDLLAAKTGPPVPASKPDTPVSKTDAPAPVKPTDPVKK